MTGTLLVVAGATMVLGLGCPVRAPGWWRGCLLVGALAGLGAAVEVLVSGVAWEWRSTFLLGGERAHLRLDGVSALFLALVCVLGGTAGAYSKEYWTDAAHPRSAARGRAWWTALLVCMGMLLLCSNGLHFLIAVGACAIAGGPFVGNPQVRHGAGSLVPVDLFIPGCPPHPLTILDGLLRLLDRLGEPWDTR